MFESLKRCPLYCVFGAVMIGGYVAMQLTGVASGGQRQPKKIDPNQIRSSSPGSWTYIYWAHGSRGK